MLVHSFMFMFMSCTVQRRRSPPSLGGLFSAPVFISTRARGSLLVQRRIFMQQHGSSTTAGPILHAAARGRGSLERHEDRPKDHEDRPKDRLLLHSRRPRCSSRCSPSGQLRASGRSRSTGSTTGTARTCTWPCVVATIKVLHTFIEPSQ